jgi:hypothetical protein
MCRATHKKVRGIHTYEVAVFLMLVGRGSIMLQYSFLYTIQLAMCVCTP